MSHNGHEINLYGVDMILMGNLHACGQSNRGHLSPVHRVRTTGLTINMEYFQAMYLVYSGIPVNV